MSGIRTIARGALVAAALVVGFASTAAGQDRPRDHRHRGDSVSRQMRFRGGARLFRGVDLTEEQRTKLSEIRTRYGEQAKALRQSARPDFDAAREARRKGDTASARAALERTREERDSLRALGQRHREEVRNLLTPEQRAVFDSNAAQPRRGGRGMHRGKHGMRRPLRRS
ncbi:MAG TPA: Spy/CpxP family protein refolding chaperone [Gemmatimonadaceae bacterium]|nr:Spy/CpxP family protein refolding chaperone [Gemmatimonadaceae bacterium]